MGGCNGPPSRRHPGERCSSPMNGTCVDQYYKGLRLLLARNWDGSCYKGLSGSEL